MILPGFGVLSDFNGIDCKEIETEMAPALDALGLFCFGWFVMADAPFTGRKASLIGNHALGDRTTCGRSFSQVAGISGRAGQSMDRWTERVVGEITKERRRWLFIHLARRLWPFQRYAKGRQPE